MVDIGEDDSEVDSEFNQAVEYRTMLQSPEPQT